MQRPYDGRKVHSRARMLRRLWGDRADPYQALLAIAASHAGTTRTTLRDGFVGAGEHNFPHPDDVRPLLFLLFKRVVENFSVCASIHDDLVTAALSVYGILAIHPFARGNGRTSLDLAQYLLMIRWKSEDPPLDVPENAHRIIGRVLGAIEAPNSGKSGEEFVQLRDSIALRIFTADLKRLHESVEFSLVAGSLETCLRGWKEKRLCHDDQISERQ